MMRSMINLKNDFIDKVDKMWDFVNSSSLNSPPGKKAISKTMFGADINRFQDYFNFISSWEFATPEGKIRKLPCHEGWKQTINAMK